MTRHSNGDLIMCLFIIQLLWATMTIKGSLQVSIATVKAFSAEILIKNWPKISVFIGGMWSKRHILARKDAI